MNHFIKRISKKSNDNTHICCLFPCSPLFMQTIFLETAQVLHCCNMWSGFEEENSEGKVIIQFSSSLFDIRFWWSPMNWIFVLQIPGVPIMYITKHRYSIERLPEATMGGGKYSLLKFIMFKDEFELRYPTLLIN